MTPLPKSEADRRSEYRTIAALNGVDYTADPMLTELFEVLTAHCPDADPDAIGAITMVLSHLDHMVSHSGPDTQVCRTGLQLAGGVIGGLAVRLADRAGIR